MSDLMYGTKQLVEAALYGSGDRRRFTLDSPVLSDVWAQFFDDPAGRPQLLMEPWLDTPAFTLADRVMGLEGIDQQAASVTYNRTVLVADLSLPEVVREILPMTGWYREATRQPITVAVASAPRLPETAEMWEDLALIDARSRDGRAEKVVSYPYPRLLGFIRMAGIVSALRLGESGGRRILWPLLFDLAAGGEGRDDVARTAIAKIVLEGWRGAELELPVPREKLVYSITRNRPAKLAIQQSVRTVKGDAAASLFTIDCSGLTWAILDSGIDRLHPAFADRRSDAGLSPEQRSRVVETYDFSYLRELLTTRDWNSLPPHVGQAAAAGQADTSDHDQLRLRRELLLRIRRAKLIDWEALRPFLRVGHGADYVRPIDTHGTHVAGILASDWDQEGGAPMVGMCPTINLIDIRVCRADGTSDEFVIMSALQFIRHLNANSDRMAVHGVNMSISLEHDAAVYACGQTPVCEEAERTIASGVVVVAAAGNHGYRRIMSESSQPFDQYCPVSITDPGNAENVITVGSTHRLEPHTYGVSYFSSRGPTGDGRFKPDLVAPGEKIFAPALHDDAMRLDGTSMAAPHVSGAAAMLMARHVELTGDPRRIKDILCDTATDLGRERYFQGRGLVDVLRAIQSV